MPNIISIAIDGPAGAGKSTIARALARELDIMYLDTGAMYRAFGLAMLRAGVDVHDAAAIAARANAVDIDVDYVNGAQRIYLSGEDVSEAIRTPEVSASASAISAVPEVRTRMVALQREIAKGHSVIMDGRDIGTVVLPNATLKVYMTASPEVRARRRCDELMAKGAPVAYDDVLRDIIERDYRDSHRAASPLRPADDAVTLDTSDMGPDAVVSAIRDMVRART